MIDGPGDVWFHTTKVSYRDGVGYDAFTTPRAWKPSVEVNTSGHEQACADTRVVGDGVTVRVYWWSSEA